MRWVGEAVGNNCIYFGFFFFVFTYLIVGTYYEYEGSQLIGPAIIMRGVMSQFLFLEEPHMQSSYPVYWPAALLRLNIRFIITSYS